MEMYWEIPTDRHGNIYYGYKTFEEADRAVQEAYEEACAYGEYNTRLSDFVVPIAEAMREAGYVRAASRLLREYGLK